MPGGTGSRPIRVAALSPSQIRPGNAGSVVCAVHEAVVGERVLHVGNLQQHMVHAEGPDEAVRLDRQRRRDGRGHEACWQSEELQLDAVDVGNHAETAGRRRIARC